MRDWQVDLERSRIALGGVVWPAIKDAIGGGTLLITEGSRNGTDLTLDYGGIDAIQKTVVRGVPVQRTIASRIQFGQPYFTTTIRESRRSGAVTEYAKRQTAREEGGNLPTLTTHAYVTKDGSRLQVCGVIDAGRLHDHQRACVGNGSNVAGCFMRTADNARFIASDWRHLMAAGVPVIVVAPGQPCMYPLKSETSDGLVWGCKPETLDLARVVNSLVKCRACGNWSTAPVAAAGVLRGTGT
jgi:hypothetical protein